MHKAATGLMLLLCCVALSCCDNAAGISSRLDEAEASLNEGDAAYARETLTSLVGDDATLHRYRVVDLCRMAVIAMHLGDSDSNSDDTQTALRCMRRAWQTSPDSVRAYISSASPQDIAAATTLLRLIDVPENPALDDFPDEPDDTPEP